MLVSTRQWKKVWQIQQIFNMMTDGLSGLRNPAALTSEHLTNQFSSRTPYMDPTKSDLHHDACCLYILGRRKLGDYQSPGNRYRLLCHESQFLVVFRAETFYLSPGPAIGLFPSSIHVTLPLCLHRVLHNKVLAWARQFPVLFCTYFEFVRDPLHPGL